MCPLIWNQYTLPQKEINSQNGSTRASRSYSNKIAKFKSFCKAINQGCRGTWKTWNFLIKSGKTLKSQGKKKLKKHRSQGKVRECFVLFVCFSGMHKIAIFDQNFRGHCFAYLLNSTLLRRSRNFHK